MCITRYCISVIRFDMDTNHMNFLIIKHIPTRKRALHARMSHSTVCYTTVCTKKTLRILVK